MVGKMLTFGFFVDGKWQTISGYIYGIHTDPMG